MDRLQELWPDLAWEQRRIDLYRAEEASPADVDGHVPPTHWRYALTATGGQVATLIVDRTFLRNDLDEQGVAEMLAQYVAAGRVQ